jgi:nucleotide-binding universal stress UspA family protein
MSPLRRILFPTDFSASADEVMTHAAHLARETGAELHVLHVYEVSASKPTSGPDEGAADFRSRITERIRQIGAEFGGEDLRTVAVVRTGEAPAPVINEYAADASIDLIVVGTHGRRGLKRVFMGSVAEEIIRSAPCPVYCIRQGEDQHTPAIRLPHRIVVPTDFSEYAHRAIAATRRFASDATEVHLVHVVEDMVPPAIYGLEYPTYHDMTAEIEQHARTELANLAGTILGGDAEVVTAVVTGYPASAITDYARDNDADLIVLTTHGRSGVERLLLGSVTEKIVRTSEIPVLIVRSFAPEGQS